MNKYTQLHIVQIAHTLHQNAPKRDLALNMHFSQLCYNIRKQLTISQVRGTNVGHTVSYLNKKVS